MSEHPRLRTFQPEDYDEVIALWRESGLTIKPSDSLGELQKLLAHPGSVFLIAEVDGANLPSEILGTVIGTWDGRRAWIYHLSVKPSVQRRNIGRSLLTTVEQTVRNNGATKINLLIEPGNRKAEAFYRALGYSHQPLQFFTKTLDR